MTVAPVGAPRLRRNAPGRPPSPLPGGSPTTWPPHWPLTAMIVGFPLWWLVGLQGVAPIALALPMALQLSRLPEVRVPRGFGYYLLFLCWAAMGAFVLLADAPGAVPGGGLSRLLVFAYQFAWYGTGAILFLWVHNLGERFLSSARVHSLLALMFVFTTLGGLAGVLLPSLDFPSLLEMVLPQGLSGNAFVRSLIHPTIASAQSLDGVSATRPVAPFAYANSWGANYALFLPFFVVAWLRHGKRWQRLAAPVILLASLAPVVLSLNRGLWACLALSAVLLLVIQITRGRLVALIATTAAAIAVVAALLATPLGATLQERLDNPHSNDRRGQLLVATVDSVSRGSPILGYGNTRDVQGSFASIAGGSTPDCPDCGVPPLGTQGQIWLVIFAQGWVGTALFLCFLVVMATRTWRCRTTNETLASFTLSSLALQLLVYDTLGLPWFTVMTALALMTREQEAAGDLRGGRNWSAIYGWLRRLAPAIAIIVLVGATVGAVVAQGREATYVARSRLLLAATPSSLDSSTGDEVNLAREVTIDTEAALVLSESTLSAALESADPQLVADLRSRVTVTAPANSRVLQVLLSGDDPDEVEAQLDTICRAYLENRGDYLDQRRSQILQLLSEQLRALDSSEALTLGDAPEGRDTAAQQSLLRDQLEAGISRLSLIETTPGEIIAVAPAERARRQFEVPVVSGAALGLGVSLLLVQRKAATAPPRARGRGGRRRRALPEHRRGAEVRLNRGWRGRRVPRSTTQGGFSG